MKQYKIIDCYRHVTAVTENNAPRSAGGERNRFDEKMN